MADCLFCAIGAGEIPANVVRESATAVVFRDLSPQAPTHLLAIPREHFDNVADLAATAPELAAHLLAEATAAAQQEGLDAGYRVVFNTGNQGGQSVNHVHAHVLGGRQMTWPPG